MNAKLAKLTVILVLVLSLMVWLRGNTYDFDIRSIIPFMRNQVTLYDWAGLAIGCLFAWGVSRIRSRGTPGG